MNRTDNEQRVRKQFEEQRPRAVNLARQFVDDPETVVDEATAIFEAMIPDMAYVDSPDSAMATSVFVCCGSLALYLALKPHGVDAHRYGSAVLHAVRNSPQPAAPGPAQDTSMREWFQDFIDAGERSQTDAQPGEFVYEVFRGDRSDFDWGMNVKSCAICHAFGKHDAMDLVPYMCATDDVMSDHGNQGLKRSGTIALGAHHCDFRYKAGAEPVRLVEQYPQQIRERGED